MGPFAIDEKVVNLSYMGWIQWWLGYPDQAVESCNEAIKAAEVLSHPHSMAFADGYASTVLGLRREIDASQEIAERQFALCSEYGIADFRTGALGHQGWVTAMRGHEDGIAQVEECVSSGRVTGLKVIQPYWLCSLADACGKVGRFERGLDVLAEALTLADEDENRYYEPETYRLKGELLLKQNDSNTEKAGNCFRRAIEIARKQSSKSFELRATTSLARLLAKQDHRDEARAMLADIYGWFSEGFDTADLIDAKALLDQFGA
jgi:predicted ATPase